MSTIDTQNIIFYLPASMFLLMACSFFLLWRIGLASAWQWSAGFLQTGCGFALSSFPIEPSFDQFVSGILYTGAAYCYGSAILLHFGKPLLQRARCLVALGFLLPHGLLVLVVPRLRWDLFLIEIVFATLIGMVIAKVAREAKRPADRSLVFSGLLVVLDCLVRAIVFTFLYPTSNEMGDFLHSAYNISVHVTTITVCLLFPFSAVAAMAAAAVQRQRMVAEHDPLSGLLNRRGFEAAVSSLRGAEHRSGAIILCDIDRFKSINDAHGHLVGDRVIVAVGQELSRHAGDKARVGRFGGEEFILFVLGATEPEARDLAEHLRLQFAARRWTEAGLSRPITVSCGIATVAPGEDPLDESIDRADRALYLAKAAGRNRVRLASAQPERQVDRAI